jgi:uncharacterized protein YaaN involved in tellurite resistance
MKLPFAPAPTVTSQPTVFDSINDSMPTSAAVVAMPQKATALVTVTPEVKAELDVLKSVTRLNIINYGHGTANEVADIADVVCGDQTVARMGEIGKNITDIIKLTQGVDPDDLNFDKSKGLIGKATSFWKKSKVEIQAQYKSTSAMIEEISVDLEKNVAAALQQNEWLEQQHQAVQRQYRALGNKVDALVLKEADEQAKADEMAATIAKKPVVDPLDVQLLEDQKDFVTKINKQADRLRRIQHVVLLQLPTIRSTQSGNLDSMDDLTSLREENLPLWKSMVMTASLGQALTTRNELSNAIHDSTNMMAKKLADMTGKNMIESAKLGQRSSFDIETMKHYQKVVIDSSREAQKHIEAGAKERAAAIPLIAGMRDELRKEFAPSKK